MTNDVAAKARVPHGDVPADDPRLVELGLEPPASMDAVYRNLERIKPLLRNEAPEGDRIARTTPLAGGALRAAGIFQMSFPVARGGLEASLADQLEIVTQVSRIDGGTGWTVCIVNASGWYASFLDDQSYAELYPTIDLPTAFSGWPAAKAVEVDGDQYLIESGRWNWGSGGYHAERWLGGAKVYDADGNPVLDAKGNHKYLGIWLPSDKVQQADNWDPMGVRGSGSSSYFLTESVVVPRRWSFDYLDDGHPFDFPLMGVAAGLAQHLMDLTLGQLRTKSQAGVSVGARDRVVLAEAMALLDMMTFGLRGMAEFMERVRQDRPSGRLTDDEGLWLRGVGTSTAELLSRVRDVTRDIYGSGYVQSGSEFGRILRDIDVALAHAQFRQSDSQSAKGGRVDRLLADPNALMAAHDLPWPLDVTAAHDAG